MELGTQVNPEKMVYLKTMRGGYNEFTKKFRFLISRNKITMKRARYSLTAIGAFAIIGGAFAFKSYRGIASYCRLGSTGVCTTSYINSQFMPTNVGSTYCTDNHFEPCTRKAALYLRP